MVLDKLDKKIITELRANGRITISELSRRIGLSATPCKLRIKKMEKEDVILGYTAVVDPNMLGAGHVAFVEVTLKETSSAALKAFNDAVRKIVEIEACHMTASSFDYFLKVRSANINDYRTTLSEKISSLPFVSHTSTYVVMETVKE